MSLNEATIMNPDLAIPQDQVRTIYVSRQGSKQSGDAMYTVNTQVEAVGTAAWRVRVRVTWPSNTTGISDSIDCDTTGGIPGFVMKLKRQKGLTLVELVVAISIGMIVLGSIYSMVLTGLRSSSSLEMKVTAGQDVRAALELMAMEIRMASYNPTFVSGIWKDATGAVSSASELQGHTVSRAE